MSDAKAKGRPITLLVPGPWPDARRAALDVGNRFSVEWIANDGGFAEAFRFGPATPDLLAQMDRCAGALLLEGHVDLPADASGIVELARALVRAGAFGVRVEESRAAWPAALWLERLADGQLFSTLVVTLFGRGVVETCGMHLFARPDARVLCDERREGQAVASSFCTYQLYEDPVLLTGQTFRPDAQSPRRVLDRWPDDRYPASHPCHNPFGIFRLDAVERPLPDGLARTFMPALVVVLLAAESKAGRRLTPEEVAALRDRSPCMAMEHRDAQQLERARGYADIDPERAWEQWQVVRAGLAPGSPS